MDLDALRDGRADRHAGIEAAVRVLEDDLHAPAQTTQRCAVEGEDVGPVEPHLTRGRLLQPRGSCGRPTTSRTRSHPPAPTSRRARPRTTPPSTARTGGVRRPEQPARRVMLDQVADLRAAASATQPRVPASSASQHRIRCPGPPAAAPAAARSYRTPSDSGDGTGTPMARRWRGGTVPPIGVSRWIGPADARDRGEQSLRVRMRGTREQLARSAPPPRSGPRTSPPPGRRGPATMPRSCVMSSTAMPRARRSSSSTSRIWACTVTSSAVVGSSATRMLRLRRARAMAIITRWRMPPLS